ncbi:MAG: thiolase family protein [Gracilibacteraceae bacterium]|jgi:acetyl-CoA C-acetyltransferase|nr:thiolase family protein [Gracilibacteraceae bacterium]
MTSKPLQLPLQKRKEDIVCVAAARTPFGRFGGALKNVDVYDLGAFIMKAVLARAGLEGRLIGEVWWGNGDTASTKDPFTPVVARQSLLKAGLPPETSAVTIDQACISSMSAVLYACRGIRAGEAGFVLTGGATSFSQEPFLLRGLRWEGRKHSSFPVEDPLIPLGYKDYAPVALDSGRLAVEYGVGREEQDEWALASHEKYGRAWERGFFAAETVPFALDGAVLHKDEQYRPDISREKLRRLKPVFSNPTCTAGNSPGMNDGAAAQIFTTRAKAEELNLPIVYTLVSIAAVALTPRVMPVSPAFALKKCLGAAGLTPDDLSLIEINEAFACVPLVSLKLLANGRFLSAAYEELAREASVQPILDYDETSYRALKAKLNINGGAVAIGHPNTASGARLMMTAAAALRENGGGYAACAVCGGLSQGAAAIIRVE